MKWMLLFWMSFAMAQSVTLTEIGKVPLQADEFCGRDASGFLYGIKDNTFFRQGEGNRRLEYQNLALGRIKRVDLRNPLRIVLFYADFNAVVMLDNQLNEIQRAIFTDIQPPLQVLACGLASQNRLWIYDSLSQRVGLYDFLQGKTTFITQPIPRPVAYATDFNDLYWLDEKGGYYKGTVFGRLTTIGRLAPTPGLLLESGRIWKATGGRVTFISDGNGTETEVLHVGKTIRDMTFADGILSIFTDHEITNYKITIR